MKRSIIVFICLAWTVPWTGTGRASVRLPSLFGDNLVLQQRSTVTLWGWGEPGEKVRVKAGWAKHTVTAVTGADGRWQVLLRTIGAGGPYEVGIEGDNRLVLRNVLLGEVWVCSGQSNMEFTIDMLGGWKGTLSSEKEDLARGRYPHLRLFTVRRDTSAVPRDTCGGVWKTATPEGAGNFSATAYFFGRELTRRLRVPVGLIATSWGGTPAEAWTRREDLQKNPEAALYLSAPNVSPDVPGHPGVLYNGMIHPLIRYPVKGFIWYQGESNRNDARTYPAVMRALITGWRDAWDLGTLPFYYVQIAPFAYEEPLSGALLREAQRKTLSVPQTGMAVTLDIGDANDIHPTNKEHVGRRLALWALARTYGLRLPAVSGPLFRSMERSGSALRVHFDHAGEGLEFRGAGPRGFALAGMDRRFVDADATIDGTTVLLSSPEIPEPVAARYAFHNTPPATLFNTAGLPASPFRSDDWPIVTASVSVTASFDPVNNGVRFVAGPAVPGMDIRYTLDGTDPTESSRLITGPVVLTEAGWFSARAFQDGTGSELVVRREFSRHRAFGRPVIYDVPIDARYPGGGSSGLVDGVTGTPNFRDGCWQGVEGRDLGVTIDLGDTVEVHGIRSGFLHDQRAWIFLPREVRYALSLDGRSFTQAATIPNSDPDSLATSVRRTFEVSLGTSRARFVRVAATTIGVCPAWHPGRGGNAWVFIDEIEVK